MMPRRALLNLTLLAMVAALAVVVWLEPGKEDAPPRPPITDVDAAAVERIAIDYAGGRPGLTLERRGDNWWLAAPYDLPANAYKADTLLDLLDAPSQGSVSVAGDGLDPFGLAPPRAVVRFDDFPVAFGDTEAIDGHRYVRAGGQVHLIQDRFFPQLNTAATGFVSYRLLAPDARPGAFRLGQWRVEREDAEWTVVPPEGGLVVDAGARLARAWQEARAVLVRPHQAAAAASGREVVVESGDGKQSITFRVLKEGDDTLFVRPDKGLAYVVPEHLAQRLLEPETHPDASDSPRESPAGGVTP